MFVPYFAVTLVQFFVTSFCFSPSCKGLSTAFSSSARHHLESPKGFFSQEALMENFLLVCPIDFVPWRAAQSYCTCILKALTDVEYVSPLGSRVALCQQASPVESWVPA